MEIDIDKVRKVMVEEVRVSNLGTRTRELRIVSDSGDVDLTLYADEAAQLEIVQVDNIYDPEPAV